jgi:RIO kinase 1
MLKYIEGDNRFKKIPRSTRPLIYLWARKEFRNLSLANKVRVRAPKPINVDGNVLLMEFIGNNGIPAPLLKETVLKDPTRVYKKLMVYLATLYKKAHLIHGDLSEYNIMILRGRPILIDFSQGVNVDHPLANELLKRDIENLNNFFERLNVEIEPFESIYRSIIKKNGERS